MTEIVLVWRTDAHLADEAPESRVDDWAATILDKLEQVGVIAREVKADAVIDGADIFNIKSPTRNSHALVRRTTAVHKIYPCDVYASVGNHDAKYGSLEFLNESPLGVLFESGVLKRLYDQHEALIKKGKLTVRIVGIPFHGTKYDMSRFSSIVKGDEDWLVAVVHCLASPTGGSMFEAEDVLRYSDLVNFAPDVWCFGHWHKNQGIQRIGEKWFVNTGSLSRGALAEDELERIPVCTVLRFTDKELRCEERPLQVKPAAEVFNLERKARQEAQTLTMEAFVDSLQSTLKPRQEGSLLDLVRSLNIPERVKERAISYLEKAGAR